MPAVSGPSGPDRCPGVRRGHSATDGVMLRVRLPGGQLTVDQLRVLADCGTIDLTSRGNIQLRGIADEDAAAGVARLLAAAGLVPPHEQIRNIVASPLAAADFRALVRDFDDALAALPALRELSGRFLFGFDDGSHDVVGLGADLCYVDGSLLIGGADHGVRCASTDAVALMIRAACEFLVLRGDRVDRWRVRDVGRASLAVRLGGRPSSVGETPRGRPVRVGAHPHGWVLAGVPLGRLTAGHVAAIAAMTTSPELVVTPWRGIVLAAPLDAVAAAGFVVDEGSPWHGLTACIGAAGCASALADVRADAVATLVPGPLPLHWAGCSKGCGRPSGPAVVAIATGSGYDIEAPSPVPPGTLSERLAAARSGR